MNHVYALLFPLLAFSGPTRAQWLADNLTKDNSLLSNGAHSPQTLEWQKEQDRVTGHISNSRLTRMKNVTNAIVAYFRDSCITEGEFSPVWHGEYFSESRGPGKDMKFTIECNFNDQKASLKILANTLGPLLMDPLVVNNQEFLTMRPPTGPDKDHPLFEYKIDGDQGDEANAGEAKEARPLQYRAWLVAMDQLPYIPVSRAEYLKEARMELIARKDEIVAEMKKNLLLRPAAIQEEDKKAALEQLSNLYSGMDLQVRTRMFLTSYKTDEEYQKENIDKATAALDSELALMDRLLAHLTAADLNKPAIVSVQAVDFHGFEDGQGGSMLIRPNAACLNGPGSADAPRFLLVRWQYDASGSMAGAIDRQMQERFDGSKLKEAILPASARTKLPN